MSYIKKIWLFGYVVFVFLFFSVFSDPSTTRQYIYSFE